MLEELGLPYDGSSGEHRQGRPVQAGVPGDLAEQQDARRSSIPRARAANRSRCSSPARSSLSRPQDRRFYPADARGRVEVDQWLFWQMGGLGPMLGQAHHFRIYAPEQVPYAIERYTNEANRLYGVLNSASRTAIRGGRVFDRRHGHLRLGQALGAPGPEHRGFPPREALARTRCWHARPSPRPEVGAEDQGQPT